MEVVAILAGLAFAINKTVFTIKALTSSAWRDALTQVLVWAVGFGGLSLAANAGVSEDLMIPGLSLPLGAMSWTSLLLVAWILGSTGSFAYDLKSAIDNTDSAAEPKLNIGPSNEPPTP